MQRQRQLHEDAVDGCILVQRGHQVCELALRRLRRQRVLDGDETALLGHAALGADIGVAGRIVTDNHHRKPCFHILCSLEIRSCLLHRFNDGCRHLSAVDGVRHRSAHALRSVASRACREDDGSFAVDESAVVYMRVYGACQHLAFESRPIET